jgi:hypothetical protein
MRRIEPPAGAGEPEVWLEKMRLADYQAVQAHREKMLGVVHKEVEKYLNTRDLVYDDEEGFPNRSRMTGEYSIGSESYIGNNEGGWIKVGISVVVRPLTGDFVRGVDTAAIATGKRFRRSSC